MRGKNITNIYVIEGIEYLSSELLNVQKEMVEMLADRVKYTLLRNYLINEYGEDVSCTIKTYFPEQIMVPVLG